MELNEREIEVISSKIPIKYYRTGHVLLKEGDISKESYFNIKGCVRLYHLVEGEERTTFFYTENRFISSIRSYPTKTPSNHYLDCVEDCLLAVIPFNIENELIQSIPSLETFTRVSLEQELANTREILFDYILSNPEQRYQKLLNNNPDLFQRVPLYHLASYLGIKAESLSRIRRRISKKTS